MLGKGFSLLTKLRGGLSNGANSRRLDRLPSRTPGVSICLFPAMMERWTQCNRVSHTPGLQLGSCVRSMTTGHLSCVLHFPPLVPAGSRLPRSFLDTCQNADSSSESEAEWSGPGSLKLPTVGPHLLLVPCVTRHPCTVHAWVQTTPPVLC